MNWISGAVSVIKSKLLWGIGAAATFAVAVVLGMVRKSGKDAQKLKQAEADLKASKTISDNSTKSKGMSDKQLDEEIDRWTRNS